MKRRMLTAKITAALLSGMLITSSISPAVVAQAETILSQNEELVDETSANYYNEIGGIVNYVQDENKVTFDLATGEKLRVSFLENGVFRIYMDPTGDFQEDPTPNSKDHITKIIDKTEDKYEKTVPVVTDGAEIVLSTANIEFS